MSGLDGHGNRIRPNVKRAVQGWWWERKNVPKDNRSSLLDYLRHEWWHRTRA